MEAIGSVAEDGPAAQLNDTGRKQADLAGKKLAEQYRDKIAVIYASPLGRARETAQIIASYLPGIQIVEDPRLMEFSHGKYETMSSKMRTQICQTKYQEIEKEAAMQGLVLDRFFKWKLSYSDLIPYDPQMIEVPHEGTPESALEVFTRVHAAVEEIANKHPGEMVLVVTWRRHQNYWDQAERRESGDQNPLPLYFEHSAKNSAVSSSNCSLTHFEKKPNSPLSFIKSEDLTQP